MKAQNLGLTSKLILLTSIFFLSFMIFFLLTFSVRNKVKVNGPIYEQIVKGKDLIADILPPPENIMESYLLVLQILGSTDETKLTELIKKSEQLRLAYISHHEYWKMHLNTGDIKITFLDSTFQPAMAFYDTMISRFIPAIKSGNKELAHTLAYGVMKDQYDKHVLAIKQLVQLASQMNSTFEKDAAMYINSRVIMLFLIGLGCIIIIVIFSFYIIQSITKPLKSLFQGLKNISSIELTETANVFKSITEQVHQGSEHIAQVSQQIAQNSNEQASYLEETALSLDEMYLTNRENADYTQQVNDLLAETMMLHETIVEAIHRMTNTMVNIKNETVELTKIDIDKGINLTFEITQILEKLHSNKTTVLGLISKIVDEYENQKLGIEQLNISVSEMNKMVQQNAVISEETAATSEELSRQAEELNSIVGTHQLGNSQLSSLDEIIKKRTSELVVARDAANAASKAKSVFLANMTHEIRTPMNAVLGFAQLLERDTSLSSESRNKVSTILKSGEHLLGIINDILEVSRIEAGRVEIRNEAVDLYNLLDDLAVMFRLQAEEKGLAFSIDINPMLPRYILTDLGKLRQVLINLLSNAVKFTKQGSISIYSNTLGSDRIEILIKDTGIGISPEEQKMLFQPFERTRSGEQVAGGTGLGLVISREYAHLLNGNITVESQIGIGSSFHFIFQANETYKKPITTKINRRVIGLAPNQEQISVLIVDDQTTNRDLLRGILQPLGFNIDEASNGEEAITKIKRIAPRIILMDLVMPGLNGIETTKTILKLGIKKSMTIIGISASALEKEKHLFVKSGINAFIAKPFHEQELFDVMNKHGGIEFETEEIRDVTLKSKAMELTLNKMPQLWNDSFSEALAHGSITRIRQLGFEAKEFDSEVSEFILESIGIYDINGLKSFFEKKI